MPNVKIYLLYNYNIFTTSSVTDGGEGSNTPLGSSDVELSFPSASFNPKQFYKFFNFTSYKIVFCYCNSVLQSFTQALF